MDARWIAILLCLPMVAGCLVEEGAVPDPVEGDLELNISAPRTVFPPSEANISLNITLRNVCDHPVLIDDSFYIGTTIHPRAVSENGTEIVLIYPLVDREVHYSSLSPGETLNVSEVLDPHFYLVDGIRRDFNWDIPGKYTVTVSWWGSKGSDFNLTSNELTITIGDYLPPEEGDLSLTISMPRTEFLIKPERMDIDIVLRNVCDHPVRVEQHFDLGGTLIGVAVSSNGTKIVFHPFYDADYDLIYTALYPGRTMSHNADLAHFSHFADVLGSEYLWDASDVFTITMYWMRGVEGSVLYVRSNTIAVTIMDCPHPNDGDLSLTISMPPYPVSLNDMNLTVDLTNVCNHPVRVDEWFYFGCALSGVITLPNNDIIDIYPEIWLDHDITYSPLLSGESKLRIFDLSYLDYAWDDPGIYHVTVVYHDELNNSDPVTSNEIIYEILEEA